MFIAFFYLLRAHGLRVSPEEWMTLTEALMQNLHGASLTGFYRLCRAVLVHSEADYDRFDGAFLEFFKDAAAGDAFPDGLLGWLDHPENVRDAMRGLLGGYDYEEKTVEEILKVFEQRLREQKEEHNGGSQWIGTRGYTNFGNGGFVPEGIRVAGQGRHRRAFEVAGERQFRDFRRDNVLDVRQFQMAFRLLRQRSAQSSGVNLEFDVDGTVRDTCDRGGTLSVRYRRPRRNAVKVLMLMDSGGSMEYYANLCSMLFQAAERDNQFKELHVYYFHNCFYASVYSDPRMRREDAVSTEWVLKNFGGEYKVILVGDAMMDMYELLEKRFDRYTGTFDRSGMDWLIRFAEQYAHLVWLNPERPPERGGYWGESYGAIADVVDMYPLSVEGLERAMKKLLVRR